MELNGIYKAIVTDTGSFWTTGRIRVRVQNTTSEPVPNDLTKSFDRTAFFKDLGTDVPCMLFTPIGGGSNHGLFVLPQINSVGLVQYLGGNFNNAVWMGGLFVPEDIVENNKLKRTVRIPNPSITAEGAGTEAILKDVKKFKDKNGTEQPDNTMVFRTKTTKSPVDNVKDMDFNEQTTENMVMINKTKFTMTHCDKWKKVDDKQKLKEYSEINMEDGTIHIDKVVYDDNDKKKMVHIKVTKAGVTVGYEDISNNHRSEILVNEKGLTLKADNCKSGAAYAESSVKMSPEEIILTDKDSSVRMTTTEIDLKAKDIRVTSDKLVIGDKGGYLVLTDIPFKTRMESGNMLYANEKVRG